VNTNNGVKWRKFIVPRKVEQINNHLLLAQLLSIASVGLVNGSVSELDSADIPFCPFDLFAVNDSCSINNGDCSQLCVHTDDGRNCSCRSGYALSEDGMACTGTYSRN